MNELEWTVQLRFIIALALGFLIGFEREISRAQKDDHLYAGIRTHSLISLFGFACAWLFQNSNVQGILPIGLLIIASFCIVSYLAKLKEGRVGWTSETAASLTFVIGALSLLADLWVPLALGVISTVLLTEKPQIEQYVDKLSQSEFVAISRFLLVTLIILPLLPNQDFTQFNLNPARIWKIVIMVSSIGFVGYFLSKKYGERVGLKLSGFLGGIASSTAVSVAMGRIAYQIPDKRWNALQASLIASSVMYLRIFVLIWVINPIFISALWWKMLVLCLIGFIFSFTIKVPPKESNVSIPELQNPFELLPALLFAFLFVALSVITVLIRESFGSRGLVVLSAVVGATDIDPFLLSLVNRNESVTEILVAAIVISMMSNTVMKGIYFAGLVKGLRTQTLWRYGLWAFLHLPLLFL